MGDFNTFLLEYDRLKKRLTQHDLKANRICAESTLGLFANLTMY